MTATPARLQLSRRKGFNLQALSLAVNGLLAVNVARPSKWGNPNKVGIWKGYDAADSVRDFSRWLDRDLGVRSRENVFGRPPSRAAIVAALRGRNLACWCHLCARHAATGKPLDEPCGECAPCHVNVLGGLANAPVCEPAP